MKRELKREEIVWSYIGQVLNLGSHILLTPIIAIRLQGYELGLWYTFSSMFTMITFFDTSTSPLILRYTSYCLSGAKEILMSGVSSNHESEANYRLLGQLINVVGKLYKKIGVGAGLILLTLGSFYIKYISRENYSIEFMLAWIIYVVGIVIYICSIYVSAILKGIGKIVDAQKIMAASRTIQTIVAVILIINNKGILGLAISFSVGNGLIGIFSTISYYKNIRFRISNYNDKNESNNISKALWFNSKKMFLLSISRYMVMQGNTLVCSTFLSLETAGRYGLTVQALQAITSIGTILYQASLPVISGAYVENNTEKVRKYFSMGILTQWIITITGELCLILFANKILIFIGSNTILLDNALLIPLAVTFFIISNYIVTNLLVEARNEMPHVKAENISGVLIILISTLMVCFVSKTPVYLVIIQTIIPCVYNGWIWPMRVWKELNTNIFKIIKEGSSCLVTVLRNKEKILN